MVQPWTASTACDEPDAPGVGASLTPSELATDVEARLVSPLSQTQIGSIVNPGLNAWFGLDGFEINDHGCCSPPRSGHRQGRERLLHPPARVQQCRADGERPQYLRRLRAERDLVSTFVVPNAVNQGDEVQFDGSTTASTLIVPNSGYRWNFGDGTTATDPAWSTRSPRRAITRCCCRWSTGAAMWPASANRFRYSSRTASR